LSLLSPFKSWNMWLPTNTLAYKYQHKTKSHLLHLLFHDLTYITILHFEVVLWIVFLKRTTPWKLKAHYNFFILGSCQIFHIRKIYYKKEEVNNFIFFVINNNILGPTFYPNVHNKTQKMVWTILCYFHKILYPITWNIHVEFAWNLHNVEW
jgi:hypothetical protein